MINDTTPFFPQELKPKWSDLCYQKFFKIIYKARYVIIIFWLLCCVIAAYPAIKFFGSTTLFISPPSSTLAYEANALVHEKFPHLTKEGDNVIAVQRLDHSTVLNDYTEQLSLCINTWLTNQPIYITSTGYYLLPSPRNLTILDKVIVNGIKQQLVSSDGDTTIISFSFDETDFSVVPIFISDLREKISSCNSDSDHYFVGVTGFEASSVDLQEEIMHSLMKMDVSVIPIAFLVLLYVLKSLPLMIIPICTICVSFVTSFGVMYPISLVMEVYGIAPALMGSCIAAMSIDYSLFLLTRFTEETSEKKSYYESISNTLRHAGRIIFTSGGLLTLCFISLCFFPLVLITALGLSAAIAVMLTIFVNLTLTPSLLSVFPNFFSQRGFIPCVKKCKNWAIRKEKKDKKSIGFWHHLAFYLTNKKIAIVAIVLVVILLIPLCVFIKDFGYTEEDTQIVPPSSDSMITYNLIGDEFGYGTANSYRLIISGTSEQNIFSTEFMNLTSDLLGELMSHPDYFDESSYVCVNYVNGDVIDPEQMLFIINDPVYSTLFSTMVSEDNTTTHSHDRLTFIRDIISDVLTRHPNFEVYLQGIGVDVSDSITLCLKYFPIIVIVLFVIVIIITCVAFQSILVPIRVVFSTTLTVLWIYGSASFIFCNNYFDWISNSMKETEDLFWVVPVLTFPILIGLSSDYDIFLLSRIMELRRKGLSTRLSVIIGVERVGHLISYAGMIMAIAFSGLFLSKILMLKQFAFILTFAVLLDAFVIRSLLLPSIVGIFDELNWFPRRYKTLYSDYDQYVALASSSSSESSIDNDRSVEQEQIN
ncbi:MmpL efflux pump [Entamoeba marina]